jgi:hypothetical protein
MVATTAAATTMTAKTNIYMTAKEEG